MESEAKQELSTLQDKVKGVESQMKVLYIYVRCYIVCCTFDLIMDMAFYTPISVSF